MPLYNPSTAFDIDITMGLTGHQGRGGTSIPSGDGLTTEAGDPLTTEAGDPLTTE